MGKSAKRRPALSDAQDKELTMHVLGAGGNRTREQKRFEQATKGAVKTLARLGMPPQELAGFIRRRLNNMHGPEWHCVVGKVKAFSVHVRYWRGKSFLLEDGGGLRIIVFRSAPPAPDDPLLRRHAEEQTEEDEQAPRYRGGGRTSIKVLRSEMEQGYQKQVLAMASAAATEVGKVGDLDNVVSAIKAALTESTGPVWHVIATRGEGDWDYSVACEKGQLLDFKLNGDRILCWKHAQALPGLADMLTAKRISLYLFVATVLLLCAYVKLQGSCDRCCSSISDVREKVGCGKGLSNSEGEPTAAQGGVGLVGVEGCDVDVTEAADICLRNAKILFSLTCATLAGATALKWTDRSKVKRQLKDKGA